MDTLVQRLAERPQPVTVGGPRPNVQDFQQRLEQIGYVFIKFTDTRGGTDLGFKVDKGATDLSGAHFAQASGIAHVEGTLTLNYQKVRCIADIDLATLQGTGNLVL
ncbi:MbtH domain protein [Tengunoibacter tsumagoiensis]|uniref:MbtH domain protein n=1 Tax=Tengunoibacter tsumagoiensis TaxID=2014871 RepID=A0A402A5V0_9CHLR|nr:MbtH domain protein [Tengunoibacter tsumagoiensis]GCE14524.1 hypothetical protein KTT_43830 [Tengunoibacter tsumagoiensis]